MWKYSSTPWVLILIFLWLMDLILKTAFQIWKRNFFNWNFAKKLGFEPGITGLWLQHSTTELSWLLFENTVPWIPIKISTAIYAPKYGFNNLKKCMCLTKIIKIFLYTYFWFQNGKLSLCNLVSRDSVTKESQEYTQILLHHWSIIFRW